MSQKELGELRRRFHPDRSVVSRVYDCYVNSGRKIISYLDESLDQMPQEETEKYLGFLKKALSETLGRSLINIVFSTGQVMDSPGHRLLSQLHSSALKDGAVRDTFYQKVIESLDMGESNHLILLAHDAYDVSHQGKNGEAQADGPDEVSQYIVCAICPVKGGKMELGFFPRENEFHSCTQGQVVTPPELGFLLPAFDDRAASIYNALFYSRRADGLHQGLIDVVLHTEPPISPTKQKEASQSALCDSLGDCCSAEAIQDVYERLREVIEQHKESKNPEPLALAVGEISSILRDCGMPKSKAEAFGEKCGESFDAGAVPNPANLIDSRCFELKTTDAAVSIGPERSYLMETRVINGRKYILVPTDEGTTELNGFPVGVTGGEDVQS